MLAGDVVDVTRLKREVEGEIVIPASHRLGRTLMTHGLVDEIRLVVFPVVSARVRLFPGGGDARAMQLVGARRVGEGLMLLTYEFSSPAPRS